MYGVPGATRDGASLLPTLERVAVPKFAPREGVRIAANDAEAQAMSNQTEVSTNRIETEHQINHRVTIRLVK